MAKQRHLTNAPITEALIDIQVVPQDGLNVAELKERIDLTQAGYYFKSSIQHVAHSMKIGSDGQPPEASIESSEIGLRFHSNDEKYVVQYRLNGLTLSRLPPYENWKSLVEETKRVWAIYIQRLEPIKITRLAARYINNLNLPLQGGESYQIYLNKLVDVPEEAPQAVEAFFQRFQLIDIPNSARVIMTLAQDPTSSGGLVPVVLDLDAFCSSDFKPNEDIWTILEHLRELKNRCFFGTITERTAELYE